MAPAPKSVTLVMPFRLDADVFERALTGDRRVNVPVLICEEALKGEEALNIEGSIVLLSAGYASPSRLPRVVAKLARANNEVVLLHDAPPSGLVDATTYAGARHQFDLNQGLEALIARVSAILRSDEAVLTAPPPTWRQSIEQRDQTLSVRERDVVTRYTSAERPSIAAIAVQLEISPNTVRVHLANARRKVGGLAGTSRDALAHGLRRRGWDE